GVDETVHVGNGSARAVNGKLTIDNVQGHSDVVIDDSLDTTARTTDMVGDSVTGPAPAVIQFANSGAVVDNLTVKGGRGGNAFTIENPPSVNGTVTLDTGSGADTTTVQRTSAPVSIDGNNGLDKVNVGLNHNVQSITAALSIANSGNFTDVTIDDSAD